MTQCEICREMGYDDCVHCGMGNPCIGCPACDYESGECVVNGACYSFRDAVSPEAVAIAGFMEKAFDAIGSNSGASLQWQAGARAVLAVAAECLAEEMEGPCQAPVGEGRVG